MKGGCEIILSIIDFRETCCHKGGRSYRTWNFRVRTKGSESDLSLSTYGRDTHQSTLDFLLDNHSILYTMEEMSHLLMALEFDMKMLFYLAIITVGIFIIPFQSDPPFYLMGGIALIGIGCVLVYRKVKK